MNVIPFPVCRTSGERNQTHDSRRSSAHARSRKPNTTDAGKQSRVLNFKSEPNNTGDAVKNIEATTGFKVTKTIELTEFLRADEDCFFVDRKKHTAALPAGSYIVNPKIQPRRTSLCLVADGDVLRLVRFSKIGGARFIGTVLSFVKKLEIE